MTMSTPGVIIGIKNTARSEFYADIIREVFPGLFFFAIKNNRTQESISSHMIYF